MQHTFSKTFLLCRQVLQLLKMGWSDKIDNKNWKAWNSKTWTNFSNAVNFECIPWQVGLKSEGEQTIHVFNTENSAHFTTANFVCTTNMYVQVNLRQKLLYLHQLTHNMTTECSLNYKFNTWKFKAQTWREHVMYRNCFWHSAQFLYTCSPHVLQKEELLTKIYLYCTHAIINRSWILTVQKVILKITFTVAIR